MRDFRHIANILLRFARLEEGEAREGLGASISIIFSFSFSFTSNSV
jgi:hypothetical protein